MATLTECPNHGGAFDCTPFCDLCEGNQEIIEYSAEELRVQTLIAIHNMRKN